MIKDYDEIRKRFLSGESQRKIAKSLGISRNTVAKYCRGVAVPWIRKVPKRTSNVLTDDIIKQINSYLMEDETEGIERQRHTAKRVFNRLVEENGFSGGESTIRAKVKELKNTIPTTFIPLQFNPGEAMQVYWGEAVVYIKGEKVKVNLFCARLCYSCKPVVIAHVM